MPHNDSDSEDEYVPPACEELGSDSEGENQSKGQHIGPHKTTLEEMQEEQRDALWASFQTSVASSSSQKREGIEDRKMVKVQKRYLFAGEYTTEILEVPEDSPDAKKWPLYEEPDNKSSLESSSFPKLEAEESQVSSAAVTNSGPKPSSKRPGPRKSKTVLGSLPSASQKAKKLTTIDKSLMDWKSHTQGTVMQDELEANRRSGGYLEKVEFLQRVEERKEENLEALKGRKRRRI